VGECGANACTVGFELKTGENLRGEESTWNRFSTWESEFSRRDIEVSRRSFKAKKEERWRHLSMPRALPAKLRDAGMLATLRRKNEVGQQS